MKKAIVIISTLIFIVMAIAPLSQASTAVTLKDLEKNLDYLFPNANYLSDLDHHSTWRELGRNSLSETSGIEVTYEAIFDESPEYTGELPHLNAYLIPTDSEQAAEAQLKSWSNRSEFKSGLWEKVLEGEDYFVYYTGAGEDTDLVKYRPLEDGSLHWVTAYDSMMIVVNFYRTSGEYLKNNVAAYLEYLENREETLSLLKEVVVYCEEAVKFYLGNDSSPEAPSDYEYHLDSASYYLDLGEMFSIPTNGTLSLDLYMDDTSEIGTVLNMNGVAPVQKGMLLVNMDEQAILEFSFYDPDTDSACRDSAGWHHLATKNALNLYAWQTIEIRYGAEYGLQLWLEGEQQGSCGVYTSRTNAPVYLGDYPYDSLAESFVGYVKNVSTQSSLVTSAGADMIFKDVSTDHHYAEAIAYMKEKGIIQGYSDGTFRPDQTVNRVEILKMLLLGFGYSVPSDFSTAKFNDLQEEAWYLSYLNYAIALGVVNGHPDGTYRPGNVVNRVEFLKILLLSYGLNLNDYPITTLYPDTDRDEWYAPYVQYSKEHDLLDPDSQGNFHPTYGVSRGEVAETLWRLLK